MASRSGSQPILGIYIRSFETQAQFYTVRGKCVHRTSARRHFKIPNFVSREELAPLLPYLPSTEVLESEVDRFDSCVGDIPRATSAHVILKLVHFYNESNEAYREHAQSIDRMYDVVAQPSRAYHATLREITIKALNLAEGASIPHSALWAVHRAMVQADVGFNIDRTFRHETGLYEIVAIRDTNTATQVRKWTRQFQEDLIGKARRDEKSTDGVEIFKFLETARRLVLRSRDVRPVVPNGGMGPCSEDSSHVSWIPSSNTFSPSDLTIIQFFKLWTAHRSIPPSSPMNSIGSIILAGLNLYDGFELDSAAGHLLLQEMGVLLPWDNQTNHFSRVALSDFEQGAPSTHGSRADGPSLEPVDSMAGLRKDWSDLEVFCIDGEDAKEIDDGISIEADAHDSSRHWIHVHVANPTAFISPGHPIARFAASISQTIYSIEGIKSMMDATLSQNHYGLAPGRPCLTFSAQLNDAGDLLDYRIVPGRIWNVISITPTTIDALLGGDGRPTPSAVSWTTGKDVVESPSQKDSLHVKSSKGNNFRTTLSAKEKGLLRQLHRLGLAHRKKGQVEGSVQFWRPGTEASLSSLPTTALADPSIRLQSQPFEPRVQVNINDNESLSLLVSNAMLLAGEVAAKWCSERSIPIPYRGTIRNPELPSPAQFKKDVLDPEIATYGSPSLRNQMRYLQLIGRSTASAEPIRHAALGLNAYAKVTSPLRRYGDMLSHWQIEAVLLEESRRGTSLAARTGTTAASTTPAIPLPFDRAHIEQAIARIIDRERIIAAAQRDTTRHWCVQFLARAFYFGEAALPPSWKVYVVRERLSTDWGAMGMVRELNLSCWIESRPEANEELRVGDWWEMRLIKVSTYAKRLTMEPIRLVERPERHEDAAED